MLHRYLDDVRRRRCYDYDQQGKPGDASLVKITDSEERDDVGEESGT